MSQESWSNYAEYPEMRSEALFSSRVVRCFSDRPKSLYQLFVDGLGMHRDAEALVCDDSRMTFGELEVIVGRVAAGLRALGVAKGGRVAFLLPNCPEYVVLLLAVAKIGAIGVPLNIREAAPELEFILNDCQAEALICSAELANGLPDLAGTPVLRVIETIDLGSERPFAAITEDISEDQTGEEQVDEQDLAIILYTSGTTGHPKGALLSHVNIVHSVLQYRHGFGLSAGDRGILAVPLSHVTGLVALTLLMVNVKGALIIMREFKADRFVDLAVAERMTFTLLVPAMFALCLLRPDIEQKDLSRWRVSGYGGAIMPEATLRRIESILPQLELLNCYGATETTSPAVMMPPSFASQRAHQVGLPVPCADIRVMDEDGREVPRDETGEIWISGPMVVSGYWNNPAANAREFVGPYWKSGDIGSMDGDGFIQIIDRKKDLINRGGYKVYASEVENLLLSHVGVKEVAVVGKPCPVLGERVHAFVIVTEGTLDSDLTAYCRGKIADYKCPEQYHVVQSLPRNANGKVLKRDLRDRL